MPLYEYYCPSCDGVFEALRTMRESSEPAHCVICDGESDRIMPTSFTAFTYRDGTPRRIPDNGMYWHFDKQVKTMNTGGVPASQHPELYKPTPAPTLSKGEQEVERDKDFYKRRHAKRMKDSDIHGPPVLKADGTPHLSPKLGM